MCLCPPLDKGFLSADPPSTCFTSRGTEHSLANSVQRSYALEWEARIDHPCVPARNFSTSCDSTSPLFVSWFLHATTPKQVFTPLCSRLHFCHVVLQLRRADRSFLQTDQQLVETPTSFSDSPPCSSVTFLPSVGTELTEYNCRSVFRSAVPLGC